MTRWLTAIPVHNEARHLETVVREVRRYADHVLVVNDGSTDGTAELLLELARAAGVRTITHPSNRGYGAAIISAIKYAVANQYEILVTMDCDGQHEPSRIPVLLEAIGEDVDIVSGSRYLRTFRQDTDPPQDRRWINHVITAELNERLGLEITDAFCGFKAYRTEALRKLRLTETGWGMPLQLWVQAARLGLRIREAAVPRVYLDANRAFGGAFDDPAARLRYYRDVIDRESGLLVCGTRGLAGKAWHGADARASPGGICPTLEGGHG